MIGDQEMSKPSIYIFVFILMLNAAAHCEKLTSTHVDVDYIGIDKAYPEAIIKIVETVREQAITNFAFDLPDRIKVHIKCNANQDVRLWTDGETNISLNIRSENDLHKPSETGIFNLYGFCHEVRHICGAPELARRIGPSRSLQGSFKRYVPDRGQDLRFALWRTGQG